MGFQRVTGMIFCIWRGKNTEQKSKQSTNKNVEFQQVEHFQASVSYQAESIANEIKLLYL